MLFHVVVQNIRDFFERVLVFPHGNDVASDGVVRQFSLDNLLDSLVNALFDFFCSRVFHFMLMDDLFLIFDPYRLLLEYFTCTGFWVLGFLGFWGEFS